MKLTNFFDNKNIISMYENHKRDKDGLRNIHLTGFYYFGLIVRTYLKYNISFFPYYDLKYFNRTLKYFKQQANPDLSNIDSLLMTISLVGARELNWFLVRRPIKTLPYWIIANKLFMLYPILFVYDVVNYIKSLTNPDINSVAYQIYRNLTPFKLHKILPKRNNIDVLNEYFDVKAGYPPINILFDRLPRKVLK